MLIANSPLGANYQELLLRPDHGRLAPLALTKNVLHWINDGLMAVFFLLVGIEIKRECTGGRARRACAARCCPRSGGWAACWCRRWCTPGSIGAGGESLAGWPIPTATDIAFALGVLALVGSRAPASLRIFLLALAVIDDLGAIVLIAVLFTAAAVLAGDVAGGALCLALLLALNRAGVHAPGAVPAASASCCGCRCSSPVCMPRSPAWRSAWRFRAARGRGRRSPPDSSIALHPWVTFAILPLFALANAGVPLQECERRRARASGHVGIALRAAAWANSPACSVSHGLAVRSDSASCPRA